MKRPIFDDFPQFETALTPGRNTLRCRAKRFFVGDHVALDFLGTIAAPRGEVIEFIPDGEVYVSCLADAGLLDFPETKELLDRFGRPALDRVAGEARDLREWFRQVSPRQPTRRRARAPK